MRRRRGRHLFALLTAAILGFTAAAAVATEKPPPSATVETGTLAGSVEGGVESWKGIPYAAPPIGPLRWRAPQPTAPWNGVLQATAYRSDCMQEPLPGDFAPLGAPPAEDCLYANVWRPAGATARLPVLVWIYGGGFVNGGSSPPVYLGANLARQGVLVLSFNYRTYLVNFAKRGDPNGGTLPVWPRYSRATDVIANFSEDGTVVVQKDPWGPELDAASSSRPSR